MTFRATPNLQGSVRRMLKPGGLLLLTVPNDPARRGSLYGRFGAELLYRCAVFDHLFRDLRIGTTWVRKA